jgi:hypothetical protein
MITHNHTPWPYEDIQKFPYLGAMINNWRERNVALFAHPTDETLLVSVGITFDTTMCVVAVEPRKAFAVALDYSARGKTYTAK